jgi:two-component system, NarL family, sensor histidine kinase UhpB
MGRGKANRRLGNRASGRRKVKPSKITEAALRESDELLRSTFENAAVGIAHLATDGRWLRVNNKFCQILGYSRRQLLAKNFAEITHPEDVPANLRWLRRVLAGEIQNYAIETRCFRKSGAIMWSNLTVSLIRDRHTQEPRYLILIIEDISARKQAEQQLRESEARLRLVIEGAGMGTWDVDVKSGKALWNENHYRILGYQPVGTPTWQMWRATIHPEDADLVLSARVSAMANRSLYCPEHRIIRADTGEIRWIAPFARFIYDDEGRPFRFVGVDFDITDRKRAEDATQRLNEELERRVSERTTELLYTQAQLRALTRRLHVLQEEERSELARELHDEFGAAFTALKMDLHWILSRLPARSEELAQKARGMSELIDHSVDSVRRTAGLLRPRLLDDFGLVAAIEWQIEEFQRRTGIRCEASLPNEASIDRSISTAVFRILQEALTNAARHAEATKVCIRLQFDSRRIHIEIEDNGKGIDLTSQAKGKSLGLFGMQERASAFGGDVQFESRQNRGTTVKVEIPL